MNLIPSTTKAWCIYIDESETVCKVQQMEDLFDNPYYAIQPYSPLSELSAPNGYVMVFVHAPNATVAAETAKPIAHTYIQTEHPFQPAFTLYFDRVTRELIKIISWDTGNMVNKTMIYTCHTDNNQALIGIDIHAADETAAKAKAFDMLKTWHPGEPDQQVDSSLPF